jgi:transposase InsO family protein
MVEYPEADRRVAGPGFVEGWYNPRRRLSALANLSPVNFEKLHEEAAASVQLLIH